MKMQLISRVGAIPFGSALERTPKRLSLEYSCQWLASRGSHKLKHNKLYMMSKVAETLSRRLSMGAKILKVVGVKKIFRYNFKVMEGEKLLKASQCYLSTTAGPIACFTISNSGLWDSQTTEELSSIFRQVITQTR